MTPGRFRTLVLRHYEKQGRHALPWRTTHDPYRILVSELMLQQTQVDRVIPFYTAFISKWPSAHALAETSLADVLRQWQGLGYNRRAKLLHEAAKIVAREFEGKMPRTIEGLEALPGVGPYTARAVAAFAYNLPVVFVETNVRTAVLHHFFADREQVPDAEVLAVLERATPSSKSSIDSRMWWSALMDYGAHLKRSGVRLNAISKGYTKQSAFKGSAREVRGAIVRALLERSATEARLTKLFPSERAPQVRAELGKLVAERLIAKRGKTFELAR
jgi:A/G-specific adenine glycosylase